jgi:thioredoxin reductase
VEQRSRLYDSLIVGGGPAGLSAALVLGRCCRKVLLCDDGRPRNVRSRALHGFLSRDGLSPLELRREAREQLRRYPSVEVRDGHVEDASCAGDGFVAHLADGSTVHARTLLLATGVKDRLPDIEGLADFWGHGVYPCPYCDAFEVCGRRLGVLGRGPDALALCRALLGWSRQVLLFTDGPTELGPEEERALERKQVRILRERVRRCAGSQDRGLEQVELADDSAVECEALFVHAGQQQRSPLVERLGCRLNPRGTVETGAFESTEVPGLFVAGDASQNVQLAIIAAAEGAEAAFAINRTLARQDFER